MTTGMRWLVASLLLALLASCDEQTPTGPVAGGGSAVAKPAGGGGGFSAELAKEFASANGSGEAKAGSGTAKAGAGEAAAKAGSGDAKAGAGEAAAKAGSGDAKAGAGSAKTGSGDPKPNPVTEPPRIATNPGPVIQSTGTAPRKVTVPAELAAIKFGMLPNWERDVQ